MTPDSRSRFGDVHDAEAHGFSFERQFSTFNLLVEPPFYQIATSHAVGSRNRHEGSGPGTLKLLEVVLARGRV